MREVKVGQQSYRLQLPVYRSDTQILRDPTLTASQGPAQPPTAISLGLCEGRAEITYRWYVGDAWVSLVAAANVVAGRHPHKPEFSLGDSPATDTEVRVETQAWKRLPRPPVWQPQTHGLEADIARTAELHARVRSWLAALPLGKV